ncbi:putative cuticle protein CPH43, partial [Danaus plexippus plexippus]
CKPHLIKLTHSALLALRTQSRLRCSLLNELSQRRVLYNSEYKGEVKMGFLTALAVNVVGGAVIYGTGGLGVGLVAPWLGFGSAGIASGSMAAAAQSYYGNLVAGSIISKLTAAAMVAPTP